jgi:hypothetical protein
VEILQPKGFGRIRLRRIDNDWTASIRMAGKTTFILAGWSGMNVAV